MPDDEVPNVAAHSLAIAASSMAASTQNSTLMSFFQ